MSGLFGGGPKFSAPPVVAAEPAPKVEDKAVQDAAAEALRKRRMARGYRSTILGSLSTAAQPGASGGQTLGS